MLLFAASPVSAATTPNIISSPNSITINTPFDIQISIQGDPNTSYNLKGRIGIDTGSLTKGLTNNTLNSVPDDWLSDTDSWSKFPTAVTDGGGFWQGSLKIKTSTTANTGDNLLIFRIRKVTGSTTTYDSSSKTLSLSSPSSPIPSSSPTPTSTPSPTSPSSSFTTTNIPSQIDSSQSFTISLNLSLPDSPNSKFYLKGAFKKEGSSNYFGLTKVSSTWIKNSTSYSDQYPITTDSSGNFSGSLEVKVDPFDSGYEGGGDYIFKAARYSSTGSGPTWSNEQNVKITVSEVEDAGEEIGVINLSKISPSPKAEVLGKSKTPPPESEKPYTLENYLKTSTKSATKAATEKSGLITKKSPNSFVLAGLVLTLAGFSSLSYIYFKNRIKS